MLAHFWCNGLEAIPLGIELLWSQAMWGQLDWPGLNLKQWEGEGKSTNKVRSNIKVQACISAQPVTSVGHLVECSHASEPIQAQV